jgi:hypothetical protein
MNFDIDISGGHIDIDLLNQLRKCLIAPALYCIFRCLYYKLSYINLHSNVKFHC